MSVQISIAGSDKSFSCAPTQTILEAALAANLILPYGCKNGACGSCRGKVANGIVTHSGHSAAALSEEQAAQGQALFCCARPADENPITIEARVIEGAAGIVIKKLPSRIVEINALSPDVLQVKLQLPATEKLQFKAGQYLEFLLRDGSRRAYSMATAPHEDGPLELHIRHMPGGKFTDALFGKTEPAVKVRDIMRVEAPLGTFFLREESAKPIVLLASGTGYAPMKALLKDIFERGLHQTRSVVLYWGGRRLADLYDHAQLLAWAAQYPQFRYVPVLSESGKEGWQGRTGFVHHAVMQDRANMAGDEVYACGAPIVVNRAQSDFVEKCGLPADAFFADSFTSAADLAK